MPSRYFLYYLRSPVFIQYVESVQTGIAYPAINDGQFYSGLLALPPLAEQHRIIAKVDELMALCDQLEQQHSNAQEAHETLVSQLLTTLTQSQNAAEFNANWQRIYAHFDVLFTTEASIDVLKQTLLQLAVMGKLVPQDPNDEPASELLERIQAEKAKLIAEGKVKKDKSLPEVSEEEINLNQKPYGWSFARWGQISNWITYGFTRPMPHENIGIPIITGKNVNNGKIIFETADHTTTEAFNELNAKDRPLVGDILITKDGSIGRTAIVETDKLFCINQSVAVIWLRRSDINRSFLKLVLDCPQSQSTFESKAEGVAIKHISVVDLGMMVLPIPPLGEQHRIVAKVDALMALCDQLKTRIQQANQQQQAIADALVAQALKPATAEIIDLATYRAAVTCNIIKYMQPNQAFGRTFAMKLLYLSQQHIGFETHLEFEREAAGPFDQWIYDFERGGVAAGWFGLVEKPLSNGNTKIEYQVKSAIEGPLAVIKNVGSAEQRKELERLLALFTDKKTEEAEIVATLFAAWNDFLIDGKSPTDDEIVQEVRENWHESKERFSPAQLKQWLEWMLKNKIVPQGRMPHTLHQQNLKLH